MKIYINETGKKCSRLIFHIACNTIAAGTMSQILHSSEIATVLPQTMQLMAVRRAAFFSLPEFNTFARTWRHVFRFCAFFSFQVGTYLNEKKKKTVWLIERKLVLWMLEKVYPNNKTVAVKNNFNIEQNFNKYHILFTA